MKKLQRVLKTGEGILVSKKENRYYLSGFTGSNGYLLLTENKKYILIEGKYMDQVAVESEEYTPILLKNKNFLIELKRLIDENSIKSLIVESHDISCDFYFDLKSLNIQLILKKTLIENLRIIKSEKEIEKIKKSCIIAEKSIYYVMNNLDKTETEKSIAFKIEKKAKEYGAEKIDFLIVASGQRGAIPHGRPTDKIIKIGELITIDFGVIVNGYHSDITRTFSFNKCENKELKKIYEIIYNAQKLGLSLVKAGVSTNYIDNMVRKYIENFGYGQYFIHGLGHGIGIQGHEFPIINEFNDILLEENMVITIEPGIYIKNIGGVRIEDTVVVKKDRCEILTKSKKEYLEVINDN